MDGRKGVVELLNKTHSNGPKELETVMITRIPTPTHTSIRRHSANSYNGGNGILIGGSGGGVGSGGSLLPKLTTVPADLSESRNNNNNSANTKNSAEGNFGLYWAVTGF